MSVDKREARLTARTPGNLRHRSPCHRPRTLAYGSRGGNVRCNSRTGLHHVLAFIREGRHRIGASGRQSMRSPRVLRRCVRARGKSGQKICFGKPLHCHARSDYTQGMIKRRSRPPEDMHRFGYPGSSRPAPAFETSGATVSTALIEYAPIMRSVIRLGSAKRLRSCRLPPERHPFFAWPRAWRLGISPGLPAHAISRPWWINALAVHVPPMLQGTPHLGPNHRHPEPDHPVQVVF